jgi:hypothetical protein
VTNDEFAALRERVMVTSVKINWLDHDTLDRLYVMVFPDGSLTVPAGSRFAFYGDFLAIDDLDEVLERAEFDIEKHRHHAEGWGK